MRWNRSSTNSQPGSEEVMNTPRGQVTEGKYTHNHPGRSVVALRDGVPPIAGSIDTGRSAVRTRPQLSELTVGADWEEIVGHGAAKPVEEETIFRSAKHGLRLRGQKKSVRGQEDTVGPVVVSTLEQNIELDETKLQGVLKVECPQRRRDFYTPLLFDFLVGGKDKCEPVMDEYGHVRYEVLVKHNDSDEWVRHPQSCAAPLEVIQDGGHIYVRATIFESSCVSLWKKMSSNLQVYKIKPIPFPQRMRHQSLVQNETKGVYIHVYMIQMSQWNTTLNSIKTVSRANGLTAAFDPCIRFNLNKYDVDMIPQFVTIPPGRSHWFEIPRCGTKICSKREAAVCIATETVGSDGGTRMRMEAMVQLRTNKILLVNLPVENGRVRGIPAASESGGVLAQAMRVLSNQANALPRSF